MYVNVCVCVFYASMVRVKLHIVSQHSELCLSTGSHSVAGHRLAISWVYYTTSCNTQSSAPEDGKNNFLQHAEVNGIINKPLLLHLVGCVYYLYR
jgi:hypothetical protein